MSWSDVLLVLGGIAVGVVVMCGVIMWLLKDTWNCF